MIDHDCTLDLNGKTLTGVVNVSEGVEVSIKNGNIVTKAAVTRSSAPTPAITNNMGKLTLTDVNVEADGACVYTIGTWTSGKTIEDLRSSRTVFTTIVGGQYKSDAEDTEEGLHPYAIMAIDNSLTVIENAVITGCGGVSLECADGNLKNVKSTATCNEGDSYGLYIYDAGTVVYDTDCKLGTVKAQKYNKNGEYKEKYGKLIVNNTEVNKKNSKAGAFGGMTWTTE